MNQPKLGIVMLDTTFDRPKGDIGNPETHAFPVVYQVVEKASVGRVVKNGDPTLIEPFVKAAKILEGKGVKAITTSCGFLALFQKEIQHKLRVPFFSSSLVQIPMVSTLTGGAVGVITARKASLTEKHFQGVNAHDTPIVIEGMEAMPAFSEAIIEEKQPLDRHAIAREMKHVTERLIENHPDIKAIVLECTNMPPYKDDLKEVTHLPIFDINSLSYYVVGSL